MNQLHLYQCLDEEGDLIAADPSVKEPLQVGYHSAAFSAARTYFIVLAARSTE
jgi:hypothetical protein